MIEYGRKLNPDRTPQKPKGIKGNRRKVIITHNSSKKTKNQLLTVKLPNLASDDVIVPGTVNLSFNIELSSTTTPNRTLVNNIGRAIVKKLAVKFEGKEVLCIEDYDVFVCYRDLWKTKFEKANAVRQGIISDNGCTENCMRLRIGAGNKDPSNAEDKAIADAYGNKFIIPLDFEALESAMPYYQSGLRNWLSYEIMFNDYGRVIKADKTDAMYEISDVSLEYDTITQPHLARLIQRKYENMALPYERVVRHSQIEVNKSDRIWSWTFSETCKSLKGILVLLEKEADFSRDTSNFYNPKIEEVSVTVEGDTNQLYTQGMHSFEQYGEICKYFAEGNHKDNNASEV